MFSWKNKKIDNVTPSNLKRNLPAYIILALAVFAMTFFGISPMGRQMMGPSGVAGSVSGEDITATDFRRAHINQSQQYQQQFQGEFDPVSMGLSSRVLNELVEELVLYKESVRNGIYSTDEEVIRVILDGEFFRSDNGRFDRATFDRYLRSQGFTEASFTEHLRRNLITNKLRSFVTSTYMMSHKSIELDYRLSQTKLNVEFIRLDRQSAPLDISQSDIEEFLASELGEGQVAAYYESNTREFIQEKEVKARHILIGFDGARRVTGDAAQRAKSDAWDLAEEVLAKVRQGGESFADLARRYTDEPGGQEKGGDLGFFRRDTMVQEFSEVAFAMEKGEVSGIVESPFGFHIIKVEDVKAGKSVSLEDAKNDIARRLIREDKAPTVLEERAQNVLAAVKAGDEAPLRQWNLQWQTTGEFALNSQTIPGGLGDASSVKNAIYQLREAGQVFPEVISAGGARYVLRLKERQEADLSSLTAERLAELAEERKFLEGFWLFSHLTSAIKERYEREGKVYRNPDFLRYDELMQAG